MEDFQRLMQWIWKLDDFGFVVRCRIDRTEALVELRKRSKEKEKTSSVNWTHPYQSKDSGGKGRESDTHNPWERHAPIAVEFNLVNRVIVSRNRGSSDSPSVFIIPTSFKRCTRGSGFWADRSIGTIWSASLSIRVTGTPELVKRIFTSYLGRDIKRKQNGAPPRARLVYLV